LYFKKAYIYLKNHKIFILILSLGCTPLLWFRNNYYLIFGDVVFPLYNLELSDIIDKLFLWDTHSYAGKLNLYLGKNVQFLSFWTFFRMLGLSFLSTEKLWFIFIFVLPGISMYYLVSVITKENKIIPKIISPIFYMFNPFVLVHSTTMQWGTLLVYGVSPLMLGLFIKGSRSEKQFRYVLLTSLSSLLSVAAGVNLVTYSILWIPVIFYIFYDILKRRKINILFFTLKIIMTVFLLNLFWIIPYAVYFNDTSSFTTTLEHIDIMYHLEWSSEYSTLGNLFRLLGKWGWLKGTKGSFYYPYHTVYSNPLFIITLYIPIMLISRIALNIKIFKKYLFFFSLLIIGFFFAKGLNTPFAFIYRFLFYNFPGFWVFRESFPRFMPMVVLSYSILLGASTQITVKTITRLNININIKKGFSILFILFLIGIILLNVWPLITGDVVPIRTGELPGSEVIIPSYWFDASDYVNTLDTNTELFLLPRSLSYQRFLWDDHPYYGQDLTPYIIKKPHLSIDSGGGYTRPLYTHKLMESIFEGIERWGITNMAKLLGLLRVQYILQRNDLDWTHFESKDLGSPEYIKQLLNNQEGITFNKSFGRLDLYEIEAKYIYPQVRIASSSILFDNLFEINELDLFFSEKFDINKVVFFSTIYPRENKSDNIYTNANFISSLRYIYNFSVSEGIYDIHVKTSDLFYNDFQRVEVNGNEINGSVIIDEWEINNLPLSDGINNLTLVKQALVNFKDDFSGNNETQLSWTEISGLWEKRNNIYAASGTWSKAFIKNITDPNETSLRNNTQLFSAISKTTQDNLHGIMISYDEENYYLVFIRPSTNSLHHRRYEKGELVMETSQHYLNLNDTWYDIIVKKNGEIFDIFIDGKLEMKLMDDVLDVNSFGIVSYGTAEFNFASYIEQSSSTYAQITINKITNNSYNESKITSIKKINPTKYKVGINATQPFYLVFSESYHPLWKIYYRTDKVNNMIHNNADATEYKHSNIFTPGDISFLLKNPLTEENHFVVDGYANGWYIDPKEIGTNDFTITIYFWPQSLLYIGLIISGSTFVILIRLCYKDKIQIIFRAISNITNKLRSTP